MLKRVLITIAAASALIGVATAQVTIVKAGKLIDPDTAKVLIDQTIVIWVLLGLAVAMVIYIVAWYRDRAG